MVHKNWPARALDLNLSWHLLAKLIDSQVDRLITLIPRILMLVIARWLSFDRLLPDTLYAEG